MKGRIQISALVFYVLTAVMIVTSLFCLVSALSWINKPFAGILLYEFPQVGSMGNREWPGYTAGLKYLDRIVSADDQPLWSGRDLVALVKDKEPGTPVRYRVESGGKTREVTVKVDRFSLKDFFLVFSIPFLGGLALYALGFVVYIMKPNTARSWVFLILSFSLGSYMVTGFETLTSYFTVHFHYLILPLYPATFIHLGLIFPEKKKFLERFPKLEYAMYLPALVLFVTFQAYLFTYEGVLKSHLLSWMPTYAQIGSWARIYSLFCVAGLILLIFHSSFKAPSGLGRSRAKMILFGVTMAFLPSVMVTIAVNFLKVNFPWNFLVFFVIFFPASIAYSIVRHNLFDADEIIKRTVGYFVITTVVVAAYAVVSVVLNVFFGQYQLADSRAFPILFTLGMILVFNPMRDRIQVIVDRIFFRKEYNYGQIIDKIGGAMTSLLDLGQILRRLVETFVDDMFIRTSSIMLFDPSKAQYAVSLARGEGMRDLEKVSLSRDEAIIQVIEETKRELTKYDVLEDPKYREVSAACSTDFEALQATLMVPLVFQDRVIGLLNLGEKKSGKPFNRQDLELLHAVSNQGAVAIENARLFQENLEKQRMEEELAIARDLQLSMLPATCPELKGYGIAATSIPAREVGGDFYDFIHMGENRVGFVIGDVTGKSVSGALVMSSSRSVFRMLSEEQLDVGDIMTRANRRIKKDIRSGMFVALLYAVLDADRGTLSLCSAGQTQPIHLSIDGGNTTLVETEGDNFPLGILEEADYQATEIPLKSGDRVVLYTDGIVEAMNEKEEMFGFERLLEVVKASRGMAADTLMNEILSRVNEFAGDAPQHDDLTVIVLSVLDEKQNS